MSDSHSSIPSQPQSAALQALPAGTAVGLYVVQRLLGVGGMGATYLVERGGRQFALKIATYDKANLSAEDVEHHEGRVRREVAALSGLAHQNIVRILGYDWYPDTDGSPYVVMEYVDGQQFLVWRAERKPSLRLLLEVFAELSDAVAEAHRIQIFHRDIKAANVLVRRGDDSPVLIDFGISRPLSSQTVTSIGSIAGTVSHFSPEHFLWPTTPEGAAGEPFEPSEGHDLWCLGLLFYEAVTNRFPFPLSRNELEIREAVLRSHPAAPSAINPSLPLVIDDLVMPLLAKRPENRTRSAEELAASIRSVLEVHASDSWDEPLVVPPKPGRPDAKTNSSRRSTRGAGSRATPNVIVSASLANAPAAVPPAEPPPLQAPSLPNVTLAASVSSPSATPVDSGGPSGTTSAPVAFAPPTGVHAAADFVQPVAAPGPQAQGVPAPPSGFVRAQQLLADSAPPPNHNRLPVILGAVAVSLLAVLVVLVSLNPAPAAQQPIQLLEAAASAVPSPVAAAPLPAASSPGPTPVATPASATSSPSRAPDAVVDIAPPARPPPSAVTARPPAPRTRDEKNIDELLQREYGRPQITAAGGVTGMKQHSPTVAEPTPEAAPAAAAPAAPAGPSWLRRARQSSSAAAEGAAPAQKPLGVRLGSHVRCRLTSVLDSRTCSSGPVQCKLVSPHIESGQVLIPSQTLAFGRCGTTAGRFTIDFGKLRLPDSRIYSFEGLAVELGTKEPGVAASRVIAAGPASSDVGGEVAKGAAGIVLGQVSGGVAQEVVRSSGQTILSQPSNGSTRGAQDALLLDQGQDFNIFVSADF